MILSNLFKNEKITYLTATLNPNGSSVPPPFDIIFSLAHPLSDAEKSPVLITIILG